MVDRGMNKKTFLDLHASVHNTEPEAYWGNAEVLYNIAKAIKFWLDCMNGGYQQFLEYRHRFDVDAQNDMLDKNKGVWLFYDFPVEKFSKKAQLTVLHHNDFLCNVSDYAILIYASCLEDETFKNIPLSILREIFEPLAEQKLTEWKNM